MKVDNIDDYHDQIRRVDSPEVHESDDDAEADRRIAMLALPGEPAATVEYINPTQTAVELLDVKSKQPAFIRIEGEDDVVTSADNTLLDTIPVAFSTAGGTCFMQVQSTDQQQALQQVDLIQQPTTQDLNQIISLINNTDLLSNLSAFTTSELAAAMS